MSCKVNLPAFFIIFSPFSVSWQHSHRWSCSLIWRTGSNRWRAAWTRRKKKSSKPAVQLRSLKSCRISRYLNRLCFHFFLCISFNWLYLKGYFSASLYFKLRATHASICLTLNKQASEIYTLLFPWKGAFHCSLLDMALIFSAVMSVTSMNHILQ